MTADSTPPNQATPPSHRLSALAPSSPKPPSACRKTSAVDTLIRRRPGRQLSASAHFFFFCTSESWATSCHAITPENMPIACSPERHSAGRWENVGRRHQPTGKLGQRGPGGAASVITHASAATFVWGRNPGRGGRRSHVWIHLCCNNT